jgi:hypothetical protein
VGSSFVGRLGPSLFEQVRPVLTPLEVVALRNQPWQRLAVSPDVEDLRLSAILSTLPGGDDRLHRARVKARVLAASDAKPRGLRPLVLAAGLVAGSASAGAIVQQLLTGIAADPPAEFDSRLEEPVAGSRVRGSVSSERAEPSVEAPDQGALAVAAPRPAPDQPQRKRTSNVATGEDPSSVFEAIRALRKGDDAARAQLLLERYLSDHPRGALSEDALALSIEAAESSGDSKARALAQRYLARYPKGRHRGLARRVLARD